ncbi:putative N-acetylglucosaminyltransferase [Buttiauxella ferragutiae ATCC 51602]|uniref:N-acetylglucosaminyltransferase n=1 Tax=Buttiauxella ferragutiae ATCC 51602 TaxID=1354252 RepID=A0ABX2WAX3_9ENTR|nr:benzoate transporter [Buttiauxella ferragutiae]OAT29159.1 putative N-acetylglucosaminyltransferase [Buttiauxella ferragutiae ATCC 51602]
MIYDCFLYYDEDMLLDIRLNVLNDYVDKFVIVESTHSFTGLPVELHFDINKFAKFRDKIIYVVFDEKPVTDSWTNEARTRNAIMNGLTTAKDDDIIIVSDVDEIIRPETITAYNPNYLCTTLYQNFYNYQFNLQVFNTDGSPRRAMLPKMTSYKNLCNFFNGEPETLRNVKRSAIRKNWLKWQWLKLRTHIVADAGWHFSWMMTAERISEKMSTISHTEYDTPELNNQEHIKNAIENGLDIWARERNLQVIDLQSGDFPDYLKKNADKFAAFIR